MSSERILGLEYRKVKDQSADSIGKQTGRKDGRDMGRKNKTAEDYPSQWKAHVKNQLLKK